MTPLQEHDAIIAEWRWVTLDHLVGAYLNGIYGEWHHIKPRSLGGNDDLSNLVWLPYIIHYRIHLLLTKFMKGIALRKMQSALGMFHDKNGVLFTIEQREEIRRANSEALFGNTHTRGITRPDISERLKKNHPCHRERFKGSTELWRAYDISNVLLSVGISANAMQRIFRTGGYHGKGAKLDNGNVSRWDWFKKSFHHLGPIVTYQTRTEAKTALRLIIKNEKPLYYGKGTNDAERAARLRRKLAKQQAQGALQCK